ncbi:hypothetical protein B0H66DRAFT_43143 [Apodospora peruviana]|uniref:Uncharacterized protein n=1 Tax=Apodospora peruviana TaxID=516989 RepID=A0AAE0MFQ2_9PEZI|nr:hypothetical protein B0H66DRAFT_43143 [Apodospora peruviana]
MDPATWVTVGTFAVGAALKAPGVINGVRAIGSSNKDLGELVVDGNRWLSHVEEIKSEMNYLCRRSSSQPRWREQKAAVLEELYLETMRLIRYCKTTMKNLVLYRKRYAKSFRAKLLHWLAMTQRSRTEVFDRRRDECALWMNIARATIFLHANYDAALGDARRSLQGGHGGHGISDGILVQCQYHAQHLRGYVADAERYCRKYPTRMSRHMEKAVDLAIFRKYWSICNDKFLELPKSSLSTVCGASTIGPPSSSEQYERRRLGPSEEVRVKPQPQPPHRDLRTLAREYDRTTEEKGLRRISERPHHSQPRIPTARSHEEPQSLQQKRQQGSHHLAVYNKTTTIQKRASPAARETPEELQRSRSRGRPLSQTRCHPNHPGEDFGENTQDRPSRHRPSSSASSISSRNSSVFSWLSAVESASSSVTRHSDIRPSSPQSRRRGITSSRHNDHKDSQDKRAERKRNTLNQPLPLAKERGRGGGGLSSHHHHHRRHCSEETETGNRGRKSGRKDHDDGARYYPPNAADNKTNARRKAQRVESKSRKDGTKPRRSSTEQRSSRHVSR